MSEIKEYTDIGHKDPKDVIWIMRGFDFEQLIASTTFTHEIIWGKDIENHWRGRWERKTGYCSIVAPIGENVKRPHRVLLDELVLHLPYVSRFYFFADGVESFSPNPKKKEIV